MRYLHRFAVTCLLEDLRSHVAWRAACSCKNVKCLLVHDARQAKVRYQQVGVVLWGTEEEVLRLQITVYDSVVMQICNRGKSRSDQVGGVGLVVAPLATYSIKKLPSERKIRHQVYCCGGVSTGEEAVEEERLRRGWAYGCSLFRNSRPESGYSGAPSTPV